MRQGHTDPAWAVPSVLALLGTATLLAAMVLSARLVLPAVAVPVPVVVVTAVLVGGLARAALLEDWLRRGTAVALPVGALVMLLGLGPYSRCVIGGLGSCGVGIAPQVPLLATGVVATAVPLYLDGRRASRVNPWF